MTIDSRELVLAAAAIALALFLVLVTDPRHQRGREAERRPVYVRAGGAIDAAAGITIRNDTRRPVWVSWEVIAPEPNGLASSLPAWGVP